jgi:hypothetical protein
MCWSNQDVAYQLSLAVTIATLRAAADEIERLQGHDRQR